MSWRFIDSHVHFWDPSRLPYPWLSEVPPISGRHGPAELFAEAVDSAPERLVFVQAECERSRAYEEVQWALDLAARDTRIAAIVAFAPMDRGSETASALDRLRARPLVRGIRHLVQGEADPDFCRRPEFTAGVRLCGKLGFTFDLCLKPRQLEAAAALVAACPGTTFVLDHGGKPEIRSGSLDPWRAGLADLAKLPNVVCKLSGLVTEAEPNAWTIDELRPYANHLLESFGAERMMLGSDWPVVKLAGGYSRWLTAARALIEHWPASARDAIAFDNARRVYRLP